MDVFEAYQSAVAALGAAVLLMFVQLIAADVIGIKNKHIPGSTIPSNHNLLLFRASRVVANTNESIGIFVLAFLFSVMSGAAAHIVAYSAWGFVFARLIYAVFYYLNLKILRSISFVFILLSVAVLFGAGASKWL
jgi:uncharacterized MAPEG superfamily protein